MQNPIRLSLTEPQERFLCSTSKHPAFVAGFGAGKSEVMAYSALGDAAHSSAALIGMYAPTYDLVRLITAPRICAKLSEQGVPHKWNKQENIVYTSYPRFGDFILRTMDNPERIVALVGSSVKSPKYYATKIGAEIATFLYASGVNIKNFRAN